MARDRKRAKQRRERRGNSPAGRASEAAPTEAPGKLARADLPGSLDHASADADEFDAALIRGAGGVAATPDTDLEEAVPASGAEDELQVTATPSGGGAAGGNGAGGEGGDGGGGGQAGGPERPSGAPLRGGNRATAFLRASWAELQRVHWPDRRQVTQATAVVLGFVAVAGAYLGLADYVAKELVELVL